MKSVIIQPLALLLGSDNKPARVQAINSRSCEVTDRWLVPSSKGYFMSNTGASGLPTVTCTDEGWVFRNLRRLPVLDMWGNIIEDGLLVATKEVPSESYIEYDGTSERRVLVRDVYGRDTRCPASKIQELMQQNSWQHLFCNLDSNKFELTQDKDVIPYSELSEDIGVLSYQSGLLPFEFTGSGAISANPADILVGNGTIAQIPDNWVSFNAQWLSWAYNSQVERIVFPKQMYKLFLMLYQCNSLAQLDLPEAVTIPYSAQQLSISILNCPKLETLVLPAYRASISVRVIDCPNLKSVRMCRKDGFVSESVEFNIGDCPHLQEVIIPDYKCASFAVDNTSSPKVVKGDNNLLKKYNTPSGGKVLMSRERFF